jgi:YD repeat-containing protein
MLGRRESRVASSDSGSWASHWTYDDLGRLWTEDHVSAQPFTYAYDGPSPRLETVFYPNGQSAWHSYATDPGRRTLTSIVNRRLDQTEFSRFEHGFDAEGQLVYIKDGDHPRYPGYDDAGQLICRNVLPDDPVGLGFAYDDCGNLEARRSFGYMETTATYDDLHQIQDRTRYSLVPPFDSSKRTFTHDDNGNVTGWQEGNDAVTYEWDAEDRLVAINHGDVRNEFSCVLSASLHCDGGAGGHVDLGGPAIVGGGWMRLGYAGLDRPRVAA